MASNYSCIQPKSNAYKSNGNLSDLYGSTRRRNMGVVVTGAWPMSQPIYEQKSVAPITGKICRERNSFEDCRVVPPPLPPAQIRQFRNSNANICRPVSMPPSFAMVPPPSSHSFCGDSNIELMPLNSRNTVPCRASVAGELTSPPTCVPWLKKIKVIKKIQRRIGMGSRGMGMSPNNMPPLLFHSVHGENITISQNGAAASRNNSFCKAIAFSDRAVKVAEKVCLKFVEVSNNWSGVLRLGFTSHDPTTLRFSLPRYACPDLTSRQGFWAKAFSDFYVKKDSVLFYYVNSAGDVHFGINGEEKGIFFSGVDTRGPLWAMLDIYGNTTCVEFVDPRAHLNNSRRSINESTTSSREEMDLPMSAIVPSFNGLKLDGVAESMPDVQYYLDADIEDLIFHRVRGRNILLSPETMPNIATRHPGEYCNSYVFTSRPILPGESIILQILHMDPAYTSSMAFGLTSCNPQSLCPESLPEDAHLLLDRPEYWVVKKDVANNPIRRDVLAFSIKYSGEVVMIKNDGPPVILMHVDSSVSLWAFFDLYGTTDKIRIVGTIKQRREQITALGNSGGRQTHLQPTLDSTRFLATKHSSTRSHSHLPRSISNGGTATSRVSDYLELSHSPNSMEANGLTTTERTQPVPSYFQDDQETVTSSGTGGYKDLSNWTVECVACCERPVDSVFYSCGHMCMCYSCAVEYWKTKEKGCCPICRAAISDVIRTYKS